MANKDRLSQYADILTKLYLLDLDRIKPLLDEVYSHTGVPSKLQPEIFRSFVLMSHLGELSISNWVAKLKSDSLLAIMIGVNPDVVPEVGNHYDFIDRLRLANPDNPVQDSLHPFRRKPRKKLGKNQKNFLVTVALFKNLLIWPCRVNPLNTGPRGFFNFLELLNQYLFLAA
ncbi:MAG: hypothetical protein HPY81_07470 [Firmicutes bacterium]|nr:hypothetical protein [Bacillota bacterium]